MTFFNRLRLAFFGGAFCAGLAPALSQASPPEFEQILVQDNLKDGYWVEAFDVNNDGRPDLVTSGLAIGEVAWYENPGVFTQGKTWEKHIMKTLPKPVAIAHADIDGDGWVDIAISHDYGNCMFNCGPNDGKISWLKNPGKPKQWTQYHIDDLVATHRLVFGKFTGEETELLALPVAGAANWQAPIPVMLYSKPENLLGAPSWPGKVLNDSFYHIIHDFDLGKFDANTNSNWDSVVLSSQEGITWLYYGQDEQWHIEPLGIGDRSQLVSPETQGNEHQFTGSGNVGVGKVGTDPYGYIVAVEPFHGNLVSVYTKTAESDLTKLRWKRTEIDVYGHPNKNGEGAGHHVMTHDFDGDGNDEFIVAQRGPTPFQGTFYYKMVMEDTAKGLRPTVKFKRTQVSTSSAARIALEDFDGDGRMDYATTGYYTPGYFLADHPQVLVFLNRNKPQ